MTTSGEMSSHQFKAVVHKKILPLQSDFGQQNGNTLRSFAQVLPLFRGDTQDVACNSYLSDLSAANTPEGFLDHVDSADQHKPMDGGLAGGMALAKCIQKTRQRNVWSGTHTKVRSVLSIVEAFDEDGRLCQAFMASVVRGGFTLLGNQVNGNVEFIIHS